jgi:biotin carboxyl carrier protein
VKLKAIIGDSEQELLLQIVEGRVQARIGARSYDIEAREIDDGSYLLFVGDRVVECRVVQVEAGATVEKGTGVVVVEAMKMQNELKSPRAGMVVAVNVKAGDTVNAGDVLAVLD